MRPPFSPDGTRIVTASDDKTARVWSGRRLGRAPRPARPRGFVHCGRRSAPTAPRIVTASQRQDGAGVEAPTAPASPWSSRPRGLRSCAAAFSPDGTRIVTASEDKTARVWRADGSRRAPRPARPRGVGSPPAGVQPRRPPRPHRAPTTARRGCGGPTARRAPLLVATRAGSTRPPSAPTGRIVTASRRRDGAGVEADGSGEPLVLAATRAGHRGRVQPRRARIVTASWTRRRGSGRPTARRAPGPSRPEARSSRPGSPDGPAHRHRFRDMTARVWPADGAASPWSFAATRAGSRAGFSPDGPASSPPPDDKRRGCGRSSRGLPELAQLAWQRIAPASLSEARKQRFFMENTPPAAHAASP